jgi:hypothetical protein
MRSSPSLATALESVSQHLVGPGPEDRTACDDRELLASVRTLLRVLDKSPADSGRAHAYADALLAPLLDPHTVPAVAREQVAALLGTALLDE